MIPTPGGLVAFDLDGTLLRGPTVCEVLAEPLGRLEEMRRFETLVSEAEITAARVEMARWYRGREKEALRRCLTAAVWAPGAKEAIGCLQRAGIEVAIASITWRFAVEWFARALAIRHFLGTDLLPTGAIDHVWGRDKGGWLERLAGDLEVPPSRIAAVGDSASDAELLRAASVRIFVGRGTPPEVPGLVHLPGADLRVVARRILDHWRNGAWSG